METLPRKSLLLYVTMKSQFILPPPKPYGNPSNNVLAAALSKSKIGAG